MSGKKSTKEVTIPKNIKERFNKNRKALLGLLEVVEVLEQIKELIIETSKQQPRLKEESLLRLYELVRVINERGYGKGLEENKMKKLLKDIEEDLSYLTNRINIPS